MHLWIDADPSGLVWTGLDCDDDLAILAARGLEALREVTIVGLSICGGNAPLLHTWPNAMTLLQSMPSVQWNVSKGAGWQSMQPAWKSLRLLASCIQEDESSDAAEAIIQATRALPPRSLTVLSLGPPSNLARAMRSAPWLSEHIRAAVLMGGELTHRRLDLNFMTDRAAAREILASGLPTTMVPVQSCAQVAVTSQTLKRLEECPTAAAHWILPKMRLQTWLMPRLVNRRIAALPGKTLSPGLREGFIPWDLVALLATIRPQLFRWDHWKVELPPCSAEPCNGTMLSTLLTDEPDGWANVARVPWLRDENEMLENILELLCSVSTTRPQPRLQLGFLPIMFAALVLGLAA
ncbi:rihB, partial [Symbiodinium pilosum]